MNIVDTILLILGRFFIGIGYYIEEDSILWNCAEMGNRICGN